MVRRAIESRYDGLCTITNLDTVRVKGVNKTEPVVYCKNQPCRLSYQKGGSASQSDTVNTSYQEIKLFIAPEIEIKVGAKITVTQNNVTETYKRSGKPLVYKYHQEVLLDAYTEG